MKKSTILGIVASTFIMVSCGNHEETAGEKLDQAIDNTEQVGDEAGVDSLQQDAQDVANDAKSLGQEMKEGAKETGRDIKEGAQKAGKDIKEGAQNAGNAVKDGANKTGNAVKSGADEFKKEMKK